MRENSKWKGDHSTREMTRRKSTRLAKMNETQSPVRYAESTPSDNDLESSSVSTSSENELESSPKIDNKDPRSSACDLMKYVAHLHIP